MKSESRVHFLKWPWIQVPVARNIYQFCYWTRCVTVQILCSLPASLDQSVDWLGYRMDNQSRGSLDGPVRSASRAHAARFNRHLMSIFRMIAVTLPWRTQGRRHPYFYPVPLLCIVQGVLWQHVLALNCMSVTAADVTSVKCVCKYSSFVVFRRTNGR